jgi:hypothetical protein
VVVADPLPVLTTDVVKRLTTFWTRFAAEPDSIRTVARRAHLREVAVPVGSEQVTVPLMDLAALAAQYPSVAADLAQASLTAEQHDVARVALLSAMATSVAGEGVAAAAAGSVVTQNLAFFDAHQDKIDELGTTGIANPEDGDGLEEMAKRQGSPAGADSFGPLGFWRTP